MYIKMQDRFKDLGLDKSLLATREDIFKPFLIVGCITKLAVGSENCAPTCFAGNDAAAKSP